jgi:hypothetical protein
MVELFFTDKVLKELFKEVEGVGWVAGRLRIGL